VNESDDVDWYHVSPTSITVVLDCDDAVYQNFTNHKLMCISGHKYDHDTGLGLEGWTITLTYPDLSTATDVTNESGYYEFCGLKAGTYTVTETLQEGWEQISAPGPIILDCNDGVGDFENKKVLEFLKQFTGSGALTGSTPPEGPFPSITSTIHEIKTGPKIWWEVTYYVKNEDDEGHYYNLWDKWGGNLMILGGYPTGYTPGGKKKPGTLNTSDQDEGENGFLINKEGYEGYLDAHGNITENVIWEATHQTNWSDGAWITPHTGDQQEGSNPGQGGGGGNDGNSYDVDVLWQIGWLEPGETATLTVYLAPGINPGGVLQFSNWDEYTINTGPRVRAYLDLNNNGYPYDDDEFLYSWDFTNQLKVIVEEDT